MEEAKQQGPYEGKLVEDLKAVVSSTEELLKATAAQTGEQVESARARVQASLRDVKAALASAQAKVVERAKEAARATDEYVHGHPWQSVGLAATVGFLIGFLVGRR